MNKIKRTLVNLMLGAIACILIVGMSSPAFSRTVSMLMQPESHLSSSLPQSAQITPQPINQHLMADLQAAESVLMAQGASSGMVQRYSAIMTKSGVFPNTPSTDAAGVAGAALVGDRLVVRGDFGSLSSALRDYATDPVNPPNPNITSGIHIHRGTTTENGPFQYALTVMMNATGNGGRFSGEYTLAPEQLQALADGKLYVDLHTKQNRAGELRGIFRQI